MRVAHPITLFPLTLTLASCGGGVLDPRGPVGAAQRIMLLDATAIMLAVAIPVIVLTLGFAWWFRAGNRRAKYLPEWSYSGRIELVTWSIPALLIVFLGGLAWTGTHDLDPPRPLDSASRPIEVQVVALDWRWLFIYPESGIASVNRLAIPIGVPIHFRITSANVMNSFFIPQLGSQIYAMPGMTTQLNLMADHEGTYRGLSAQFSGEGFSDMQFAVAAMPPDAFADWIESARARDERLDAQTYALLARPTSARGELIFGRVETGLFDAVSGGPSQSVRHEGH